jgi:hypothetical protein
MIPVRLKYMPLECELGLCIIGILYAVFEGPIVRIDIAMDIFCMCRLRVSLRRSP